MASIKQKALTGRLRTCQLLALIAAGGGSCATPAQAEAARTVSVLALAHAEQGANAALRACLVKGFKVSVSVVDTDGVIKVQLRGDGSPIHSLQFSYRKAFTTVSMAPMFGVATSSDIIAAIKSKNPVATTSAGAGATDLLFLPGGALIKIDGQPVGAIGVSGAPNSTVDETCALAGIQAIRDGSSDVVQH